MKPSKAQQKVLDLMSKDWQLCRDMAVLRHANIRLQNGGCGHGGESKKVNTNTFYALYYKKLIKLSERKFPCEHYKKA